MKKCVVCGTECASELFRCACCQAILPSKEIETPISHSSTLAKFCSCGYRNKKTAVRCENCGNFLDSIPVTVVYGDRLQTKKKLVSIKVSSGEIIPVEGELIVGREYQDNLWDCYSHRATYRIHYESDCIMIDDLINKTTNPISFEKEYEMGRKTFKIIEEK